MFPFYWNDTQYYECTDEDDSAEWCAIEVVEKGETSFDWSYCENGC